MPAKRKSSARVIKQNNLLIVALLAVLVFILLVVFGAIKSSKFGQLSLRKDKQESKAAYDIPSAPSTKDIIISAIGACDSSKNRKYSFGLKPAATPPGAVPYVRAKWHVPDANPLPTGSGSTVETTLYAGWTTVGSYRLVDLWMIRGYKLSDGSFVESPWSNLIFFATTCKDGPAYCLPFGDVNGNGVRDAADAQLIQRHVAGLLKGDQRLSIYQEFAADMDKNGKIDAKDALYILRDVVGLGHYCF